MKRERLNEVLSKMFKLEYRMTEHLLEYKNRVYDSYTELSNDFHDLEDDNDDGRMTAHKEILDKLNSMKKKFPVGHYKALRQVFDPLLDGLKSKSLGVYGGFQDYKPNTQNDRSLKIQLPHIAKVKIKYRDKS